jgi:flagellar export protein FliJ
MKPKLLEKLIKKSRAEIDDIRVEKVQLENKLETLQKALEKSKKELKKEQEIAAKDVHARHTYEHFYNVTTEKQHQFKTDINKTENKIEKAEQRLFDQFKTVKQYEILLNKYLDDQRIRFEKEENKLLDELGIFRNRHVG